MAEKNESIPHMDENGIMTFSDGRRFQINEAGEIVALDGTYVDEKSAQEKDRDTEYANLDYLINSHPDRLDDVEAARARRKTLQKEMGIDSKKSADAFAKARDKLRARLNQKNNPGMIDIMAQQKQND